MKKTLRVGLTGGIGSGKTTVCRLFEGLGVPIIDADKIAHQVTRPGQAAWHAVRAEFGEQVLDAQGRLDRGALRSLVFTDTKSRERLEAIIHPRVYAEMEKRASLVTTPYCILSVPLLLETGGQAMVDQVLVVDAPAEIRKTRVMERDHVSEAQVEAIIRTQASREKRLAAAHAVITNDSDVAHLERQVLRLNRHYLGLSESVDVGKNKKTLGACRT